MEFHGIRWIQWNSMEFNGIPLNFPWNYETEVDGIPWNSMKNSMEFHGIPSIDGI
jgi:hypothetical protein